MSNKICPPPYRLIENHVHDGPAGIAGLQRGDLIVNINGWIIQNVDDLQRFLSDWPIGRPLEIQALRGQERRILAIVAQEATQ